MSNYSLQQRVVTNVVTWTKSCSQRADEEFISKMFFFLSIYKRKIIKFFIQSQKCRRASLKSLSSSCQPWIHATYYLPKSDIY